MAFVKSFYFLLVCALLNVTHGQVKTVNGKIHMLIGTTANCPDLANFMLQLVPVYEKYKQFLDIEFVAWGRSTRAADGQLTCQFGANGCWANRYHRCVLDMLKEDADATIKFMQCEYTDARPGYSGNYLCAVEAGLRVIEVDYCVASNNEALERAAEEATTLPLREIDFIPFIVFNGEIDRDVSTEARLRLESVICFALADDPSTGITHCKL